MPEEPEEQKRVLVEELKDEAYARRRLASSPLHALFALEPPVKKIEIGVSDSMQFDDAPADADGPN